MEPPNPPNTTKKKLEKNAPSTHMYTSDEKEEKTERKEEMTDCCQLFDCFYKTSKTANTMKKTLSSFI